jgi:N-acetylglucosamine PTS system EIICBA or EIICB component
MKPALGFLQQLGRALMLPIAVLPVAGLLLRMGQPDLLDIAWVEAAGDAIFSNLGLLFAVGVAVGFARENHGAAGLAAVVGFLVTTHGAQVALSVPPDVVAGLSGKMRDLAAAAYKSGELAKLSVPLGILSGLIAGFCYNRFSDITLPSYLAFFGGRRFVPILTGFLGLLVALVCGYTWPYLEQGLDAFSHAVLGSGAAGLFIYGTLNRILVVTGLHHILNNVAWFLIGDFHGVTGDLNRFFAGDPSAGDFMSGFFPVFMFGLPAACLAMYRSAPPKRRAAVGGLLLSMALTAFLTGVTEPVEFSFMFLAPLLYALHAVLTGLSMVIMHVARVHLGFSFSAGLFDYLLNYGRATRPLLLLPLGVLYFGLYYGVFRLCIVRFDLLTPGREAEAPTAAVADDAAAEGFIAALGGAGNLQSVDACTTRLRLVVRDSAAVDQAALRRLGSRGLVDLGAGSLQVVLGPIADQVAGRIRAGLSRSGQGVDAHTATSKLPGSAHPPATAGKTGASSVSRQTAAAWIAALGGRANVGRLELGGDRLLLQPQHIHELDIGALEELGVRAVARLKDGATQLLLGPAAVPVYAAVRAVIES